LKEVIKMKTIKKILCAALAVSLLFVALTGCEKAENPKAKLRVVIVQHLSHTSLDQIRDTIKAEIAAANRDDIIIIERNANGDTSSLPSILENEKTDGASIIIAIATPAAQSAKSVFEGTGVPIVFAAVSDPVAAGLTGEGSENITGVSNNIPAAEIVKLISHFQPDYQKIGFLYTSSETNSVSTINSAKAYCDANGVAYEEKSIAQLTELEAAVGSLLGTGVDVLFTGNDNSIASAMPAYTDIAYAKNVPIYCGADSMVADGGFATTGVNYVQLGKQVAAIALKVGDGTKPADIPYEVLSEYAKFVNLQAAGRIGLTITDEALEGYGVLVEADGTSHFGE
jgi:putative ABC transport system substrate-binding protein